MASSLQPIQEILLSNGMTVLLQHVDAPVAALYWWVNVGSVHESPDQAGFAHFLEHMLFKDAAAKETGLPSVGQMARQIESLGGDINAYTSFEQTVYHVTCAVTHLEKILRVFLPIVSTTSFLKKDFEREREVILEEYRKNLDSAHRQLYEEIFALAFRQYPYGRSVIGTKEVLESATVKQLEKFYKSHYCADHMGFIVVGPLGDARLKAKLLGEIKTTLDQIPASKHGAKDFTYPQETLLRKNAAWKVQPFAVQSPMMVISFRIPGLRSPDAPLLELLIGILGVSEVSRWYKTCFYERGLVTDISGSVYLGEEVGLVTIHVEYERVEQTLEVLNAVYEQILLAHITCFSQEEMDRVTTLIESEKIYAQQTVDGVAHRIGFLKFVAKDMHYEDAYIKAMKSASLEDVKAAACKYLIAERCNGVIFVPKKTQDRKTLAQACQKLTEKTLQASSAQGQPEAAGLRRGKGGVSNSQEAMWSWVSPQGMRVIVHPRKSQIASVHVSALGGVRGERAVSQDLGIALGSSHLFSSTWTKGTAKRSRQEIAALLESKAADCNTFSGKQAVGIYMTSLKKDFVGLWDLLVDCVTNPEFLLPELETAQRVTLEAIRSLPNHAASLCGRIFSQELYGEHPYAHDPLGTLETVPKVQTAMLHTLHRAWIQPKRLSISFSGDWSKAAIEDHISTLEASLLLRPETALLQDTLIPKPKALLKPQEKIVSLQREQAHVMIGGLGLDCFDPKAHVLSVMDSILNGQGGRLFVELREKRSLAYTVSSNYFLGLEKGHVLAYIGCAPNKIELARHAMLEVYECLASQGPSQKEMKRAQEYILGRHAMELQTDYARAGYYGLQQLCNMPYLTEEAFAAKIRSVTAEQIKELCHTLFFEQPLLTVVVQ